MSDLKDFRLRTKVSTKDMIDVVQKIYPKYDKVMQSKCENGELYGVQLAPDAMAALRAAFEPEAPKKTPRRDKHRLTCSIRARLETPVYEALQQRIEADGHTTAQDWLTEKILAYLAEEEEP